MLDREGVATVGSMLLLFMLALTIAGVYTWRSGVNESFGRHMWGFYKPFLSFLGSLSLLVGIVVLGILLFVVIRDLLLELYPT